MVLCLGNKVIDTIQVDTEGNWEQYSKTYSVPDGKSILRIKGGSGEFALDKISFTKIEKQEPVTSSNDIVKPKFDVFPNPVKNNLLIIHINQSAINGESKLKITDMNGKVVYDNRTVSKDNKINIKLKSGIYSISLTDSDGAISKGVIIK